MGLEGTARMMHKTSLRKGLVQVAVSGDAMAGTPIMSGEKLAGTLLSRSGDHAIAYLRFARAQGPMTAGDAAVSWEGAGH